MVQAQDWLCLTRALASSCKDWTPTTRMACGFQVSIQASMADLQLTGQDRQYVQLAASLFPYVIMLNGIASLQNVCLTWCRRWSSLIAL